MQLRKISKQLSHLYKKTSEKVAMHMFTHDMLVLLHAVSSTSKAYSIVECVCFMTLHDHTMQRSDAVVGEM
jgi:hypothetical protein